MRICDFKKVVPGCVVYVKKGIIKNAEECIVPTIVLSVNQKNAYLQGMCKIQEKIFKFWINRKDILPANFDQHKCAFCNDTNVHLLYNSNDPDYYYNMCSDCGARYILIHTD